MELFAGEAKPLVTKDECLLTAKIIEKAVESYKTGQVVNFWRTELITSLLHILVLIIARLTGMTNTELTIIKGNLSNPICVQSLELCYMRTFWIFKNYFFLCTFTLCNQTPCLFWHKTDLTARQFCLSLSLMKPRIRFLQLIWGVFFIKNYQLFHIRKPSEKSSDTWVHFILSKFVVYSFSLVGMKQALESKAKKRSVK